MDDEGDHDLDGRPCLCEQCMERRDREAVEDEDED